MHKLCVDIFLTIWTDAQIMCNHLVYCNSPDCSELYLLFVNVMLSSIYFDIDLSEDCVEQQSSHAVQCVVQLSSWIPDLGIGLSDDVTCSLQDFHFPLHK